MNEASSVSEIVRADYRTADVFKKWGINYCCGGNATLAEACAVRNVDIAVLSGELANATQPAACGRRLDFSSWSLSFLVEYLLHVHHAYLDQTLPELGATLSSFAQGHQSKYPYMKEVNRAFAALSTALMVHQRHQEKATFPYMKQVANAHRNSDVYGRLFIRTLRRPVEEAIVKEHGQVATLIEALRAATNGYQFGADTCTNHQVIYRKLKEFDDDLVQHVFIENAVLLPKLARLERELHSEGQAS
ncbi:MAG: hypothetical protein JWP27_1779 [Flaviaesturariibacter sp.]|nr:hypothetical protein [Flaviaesturariibacter sp.]